MQAVLDPVVDLGKQGLLDFQRLVQRRFGEADGIPVLINIITPFGAYLAGEAIGASGILSAVAAGITMSYMELSGGASPSTRIRRNVMDTRRAVSFMMRSRMLNAEQFEEARQILRDIDSLDSHTAFLFDKINFLLAATVGFVNINQNKIIKIFSVASVAFLPPTLIASIYGMNFKWLP